MYCNIEQLYDYFLKQFKFMIGSMLYKAGQLRLISRKENFIIFSYNDENNRVKTLEIPLPYKILKLGEGNFEFDYTVDTLCNTENGEYNDLKLAVLAVNLDNQHIFFNKKVKLIFS